MAKGRFGSGYLSAQLHHRAEFASPALSCANRLVSVAFRTATRCVRTDFGLSRVEDIHGREASFAPHAIPKVDRKTGVAGPQGIPHMAVPCGVLLDLRDSVHGKGAGTAQPKQVATRTRVVTPEYSA